MTRRDLLPLALLVLLPAFLLGPSLGTGKTYFLNDLTNISYPWRAMTAEQLQRGQTPLWNPYAYLGMPLLGNFQTALFHPFSMLFHVFPFAGALGFFLLCVHAFAGLCAYLWLRRRFAPGPALGGAGALSLGGYMAGHLQFTNLVETFSHLPLLFLAAEDAALFGLSSALALLGGYPPVWAGLTGSLFWLVPALGGFAGGRRWATLACGCALGLAVAALAVLPGAELIRSSSRAAGMKEEERTAYSLRPLELASIAQPALARRLDFLRQEPHPGMERVVWTREGVASTFTFRSEIYVDEFADPSGIRYIPWKSGFIGVSGVALAVFGLAFCFSVRPAAAAALALFVAGVCALMLGKNFAAALWLWRRAPFLTSLRGPARLVYLLSAAWMPLAAMGLAGLARRSRAAALAAATVLLGELLWTGWGFYPTIAADYFHEPGPLVEFLRENLGGLRYYQYPALEVWPYVNRDFPDPRYRRYKDFIYRTYKQKLFGVVQGTYHLSSATGGYEPLVPAASERVIGFFDPEDPNRRLDSLRKLRWAGCRFAMDRRPLALDTLKDRGAHLWRIYEEPKALSRAYWFPKAMEAALAAGFDAMPAEAPAVAWRYARTREDRFEAAGTAAESGLLFLAEPLYPGWRAYVNGKPAPRRRALDAFTFLEVPAGPARVDFVYRPWTWRAGLLITLLSLGGLAWRQGRRVLLRTRDLITIQVE